MGSKLLEVLAIGSIQSEFKRARLKLTLRYIVIITGILVIFSSLTYYIIMTRYVQMIVPTFSMSQNEAEEKAKKIYSEEVREIKERVRNDIREITVVFTNNEEILFSPFYPNGKIKSHNSMQDTFINGIEASLIQINILLFFISSGLAYLLAGKTLKPIKKRMLREEVFIQDAAHELRNPLSCIKLICQSELKSGKKQNWQEVLEETDRLINISEGLLTLSKGNDGEESNINLKEFIENIVKTILPLAQEKNITIHQELHDFFLFGKESGLEKVIFNLLHNAIKFSHPNGKIHIYLSSTGKLIIEDFGIGISKKDILHIFQRFYKTDTARNFENGGSGLGLSIARIILEDMGASIQVLSSLGVGTKFIIKF